MGKNEVKLIWNKNEDLSLASIVLDAIREGDTQIKAFEHASMKIGRTVTACGFRWNNQLRKQYEMEIKEAKQTAKGIIKTKNPTKLEVTTLEVATNVSQSHATDYFSDPITPIITSVDIIREKLTGMSTYILELESQMSKRDKVISDLRKELAEYKYYSEDVPLLMQLFRKAKEIGFMDKIS
ncbi:hypothetical protein HQN89_30885 [Paenibacillus frigoriresistens]|uniref:hypothetical protein n=1 Tax=Paenibacillus alginolyticus TaxID=59839 RepID=UPI0015672CF2|nr:hypothetical protein [Paenibacillus frigoriresistens]NRF95288.1 hypothetical protein [Paenibacillus frigoriresistens]